MNERLSRRRFIKQGLIAGAGLSLGLHTVLEAQAMDSHLEISGGKRVHDPVIIKEKDSYYLFCTGPGIPVRKSADLMNWQLAFPASVFAKPPAWVAEKIPNQQDVWAPDISYYNGKYYLYYSVSSFGKNTSVIGLATNKTLDNKAEGFGWVDEGLVIESVSSNNYNCIDPNMIVDAQGQPWLVFGSFWSGIKMHKLDPETGKLSTEDTELYSLASRTVNYGAVEAPFMIYKDGYYYLFVSFDFCCRGADSTYQVRVGRSEMITGPFVDQEGKDLLKGGGTQVTFPNETYKGPGHNAILLEDGIYYIVYHAYNADNNGVSELRIAPLSWDSDGWPHL
ncbi:MAG: arabinan endo-1,5-alpha-L-arabinosidase [Trueperaceae bacterium]|nr:arabinan endo-1,5-alpha-L-arabinosidase [Trueperaceae bacterium]